MHRSVRLFLPILILAAGCSENSTAPGSAGTTAGFAGSDTCEPCHSEISAMWEESGHPYALIAVDGAAPVQEYTRLAAFRADPIRPPVPYSWGGISYVAGGYGWKMLWIGGNGFPIFSITPGNVSLYSFADQSWSFWGSYLNRNDPADCGGCHATGWIPDEDWETDGDLSDNQDGLEGMSGRFAAPGIHCEACHGMGRRHTKSPKLSHLVVDRSSADCGRCHRKDPQNDPLASWGFITANSQYDEWLHSGHALKGTVVECVDCHDPHASVKYDDQALGDGTFTTCEGCHPGAATVNHHDEFAPTACVDCHMPFAVRSAYHQQFYAGDMRTHLVDISVEATGRANGMGMINGTSNITQDDLGIARITLDLACYGCHQDSDGEGGTASELSLEQLAGLGARIHKPRS